MILVKLLNSTCYDTDYIYMDNYYNLNQEKKS